MYDLSKIDKPFGQLTPPVQEALKKYEKGGGKVVWLLGGQWRPCYPSWDGRIVYRADPSHYTAGKWRLGMPAAYRHDPFTEVYVDSPSIIAGETYPLVSVSKRYASKTHTADGREWADIAKPQPYDLVHLQTKPARKPSVDWSHVGPEINHIARASNGTEWGSSVMPYAHGLHWHSNGEIWNLSGILASYDPGDVPWHDSLISRPGHEGNE